MAVFAGTLGIGFVASGGCLLLVGNVVALAGPVHGPNWAAAAIIAWIAILLFAFGSLLIACANAISK